jgi:hypothetical protein
MRNIPELEREVRDLINHPRKHFQLSRDRAAFSRLCSSLDVLGDTEIAFDAYLHGEEQRPFGEEYLQLYGVLQALILQQDAVKHLHKALGLKYEAEPHLRDIREARNRASGHPTELTRKGAVSFHQISRVSITKPGFDLVTTDATGDMQIQEIEVPPMIERQRALLAKALTAVVRILKGEEMEHRKNFRDQKLADTFPKSLGYTYEKIGETINGRNSSGVGASLIKSLIDTIAAFKSALNARGELEAHDDAVGHRLMEIEYPLNELHGYFDETRESKLNRQDASIFLFFVTKRMENLLTLAQEIDEEYSTDLMN